MADFQSFLGRDPNLSMPPEELRDTLRHLLTELPAATNQMAPGQMQELIGALPRLTESELLSLGHRDSLCPICFTPFLALLAEEEVALAMDSPAHPIEELGVTRLARSWQCGHLFCRRELSQISLRRQIDANQRPRTSISKWIHGAHDSCPTCRRLLVEPSVRSESGSPDVHVADTSSNHALVLELENQIAAMSGGSPFFADERVSQSFEQLLSAERARLSEDDHDRNDYVGMYS